MSTVAYISCDSGYIHDGARLDIGTQLVNLQSAQIQVVKIEKPLKNYHNNFNVDFAN